MKNENWNRYKSIIEWHKSYCFTLVLMNNYSEIKSLMERTRFKYSDLLYKEYISGLISFEMFNHLDKLLFNLVQEF